MSSKIIGKRGLLFLITMTGLINNTPYVVVISGSQEFAKRLSMQQFMAAIPFFLVAFSAITSYVNSVFLLKIPHNRRLMTAIYLGAAGILGYGICNALQGKFVFFLGLLCCLLMGISQAYGQTVMIGYLKRFPSQYIVGWASGTGLAGPAGSAYYLLMVAAGVKPTIIYLSLLPLLLVFWIIFTQIDNHEVELQQSQQEYQDSLGDRKDQEKSVQNKLFNLENAKVVLSKIGALVFNLAAVYFLQYAILTGFADFANKTIDPKDPFYVKQAYPILNFCYQIAVFLSRSSLYCFTIKKTWILTLIQLGSFIGWAVIPFLQINLFIQFGWMFLVGLIGGSSYVNTYHCILQSFILKKQQKQLSANVCCILYNIGVLSAQVFVLILASTVYK